MKAFSVRTGKKAGLTFTPAKNIDPNVKIQFAVTIAKYNQDFLLVYNRFRACWEIPGGLVEPGETAREAALRELFEETGQTSLTDRLLEVREAPDVKRLGVLYGCGIVMLQPFTPSEEIAELALWRGQTYIGAHHLGRVSALDRRLLALFDESEHLD